MSLKELLKNEEILNKYGIVIRDNEPTLRFAEDIKVIGINNDKNQIAVISYCPPYRNCDTDIGLSSIREILLEYSIIGYLDEYLIENSDWKGKLDCVWENDEELKMLLLNQYSEYRSILVLQKGYTGVLV